MAAVSKAADLRDALARVVAHDPDALAWLEGNGQLVVGRYPAAAAVFDFATESFSGGPPTSGPTLVAMPPIGGRRTGRFEIRLPDARAEFSSAKEMLVRGLGLIEKARPGTLAKLARHKGRTKRMVARRREDLYDKPHLASLSEEVAPGWYAGTNASTAEIERMLRRAIEAAGWTWGLDAEARRIS